LNNLKIPESLCNVTTAYYYYAAAGLYDTANFTYNGNKIIKSEGELNIVTYEYSGDNIAARKFFDKTAGEYYQNDIIEYDGSNRITSLTTWQYPSRQDTARIIYLFNYIGNDIDNITRIETWFSGRPISDTTVSKFHNSGGNTSLITTTDLHGNLYDSIRYQYNTEPNYFRGVHPHFHLLDANFYLHNSSVYNIPYFYSTNNVIRYIENGTQDFNMVYTLDASNNLTGIDMAGVPYMKYKYSCTP
jgi:hypothetical protein